MIIKSSMENTGKIIIASQEKANTIVFHFSEWTFLSISPDGGVEMPHYGRESCLTSFLVFSNNLLSTGITTIATHSSQPKKPLATVHSPVTVLFCRGIGFFAYLRWNCLILVHNSSISFYKCVPLFFAFLKNFNFFWQGSPLTLRIIPPRNFRYWRNFLSTLMVCLHLYSLHERPIYGLLAQHARLKLKGHSWLGLTGKSVFPTEVVGFHRQSVLRHGNCMFRDSWGATSMNSSGCKPHTPLRWQLIFPKH
jgi:hypothetical protein